MYETVIRLFGPGDNYANQGALTNQDYLICPAKINLLEIVLEQSLKPTSNHWRRISHKYYQ
jgi:hypothetical protein